MKSVTFILLSVLTVMTVEASGQSSFGTLVSARVMSEIDTETSGDVTKADLLVTNDVYVGGELYITSGTKIENNVIITDKRGVGKPAIIQIDAVSTTTIDGKTVSLSGTFTKAGKSNRGKALGVGLGVGLGTILFPMLAYIAKKGEDVVIKTNTLINEYIIAE